MGTNSLPSHHIPRPRLTDACAEERVVVVEAAAGYGKSVLAVELVDSWGAVPIEVLLDDGGVSGQLLAGRVRTAVMRAGFLDAAAAMVAAGTDPPGAVDEMLSALAGEACAIVIDDAHHAQHDAGSLIERIAGRLSEPQRLVVLARELPAGTERLRRAEAVRLSAVDLALRPEETLALCRSGFGLDVSRDEARLLDAATGGWTAAAVLAASRAKRTSWRLPELAGVNGVDRTRLSDTVGSILEELLVAVAPDRAMLDQVARLPLLDRELLKTVTGEPGFLERMRALGLPLSPASDGWWELPGPVRDHLALSTAPDPRVLVLAASHYERRGRLGTALQMLLGAGEAEPAAQLLAQADPRAVESLDVLELLAVVERIPPRVLECHPWGTFQVVRACAVAAELDLRMRLLAKLDRSVSESDDPVLRRAIDAELAIEVLNSGSPVRGEAQGRRILEAAGANEQLTRARALNVVGHALCWRRDEQGVMLESTLRQAAQYLDEATDLYRSVGYPEGATGVAAVRAIWTELGVGRPLAALEVIEAALGDCADRPRRVGRLLYHRAEVLGELGRIDEGVSNLEEAEAIGRVHNDRISIGLSHWGRAVLASLRGDPEATLHHVAEAEANRGEWWSVVGAEFLAEAADCLDRVGHAGLAWDYLARAREDPQSAERWIAMGECALLARHGDPELAEQRLRTVHRHGIFPREYWRVTLLRAYAAWRRGDAVAGALAARAFEEAARLGQAKLPLIREQGLTESLLALAAETGSPAAAALDATSLPMGLAVLGRFELSRGGRPLTLPPGQSAQLLKLVAVSGGRSHAERVIEALWPDVTPEAGRNRLRTVLGRLRDVAGEVLMREGELLVLGGDVGLDLAEFEREARQALAFGRGDPGRAVALARSAIARYRGDLLPHDLYEEWADAPREAARGTMLDLLDLCAAAAADRGDLDEARRMVERTIELAPFEDDRYLTVARILLEQGRRGAALSVLRRARSTLAALGVELKLELPELPQPATPAADATGIAGIARTS